PGTRFAELHARGRLSVPGGEPSAEMYEITQALTAATGLPAYEVSNHAAPGAESRHNLVYWRYGDYAGIGPGAHGRLTLPEGRRVATETLHDPAAWLAAVRAGTGPSTMETVAPAAQADEMMLMGMRLSEGVDLARYERLAGRALAPDAVAALSEDGLVEQRAGKLRATPAGRLLLNRVLAELLA
ncbi:MAG: coproporphyrinogen III oxidase, partial [Pseudomonadota bacterium]